MLFEKKEKNEVVDEAEKAIVNDFIEELKKDEEKTKSVQVESDMETGKNLVEIAKDVKAGKYGPFNSNLEARLKRNGYDPNYVKAIISTLR